MSADPRVDAAAAYLTRPGGYNLWPSDARRIAAEVIAAIDAMTDDDLAVARRDDAALPGDLAAWGRKS